MDALDAHVTQEDVVRLVLLRTEDDQDPLHELQTQKYTFCLPSRFSYKYRNGNIGIFVFIA